MFGVDRQALVMSIAVPVIIASILGWLDSTATSENPGSKTRVAFVDEDHSDVSKDIFARLLKSDNVKPERETDMNWVLKEVKHGWIPAAVVIPKGFSAQAAASFSGGKKPDLPMYEDPGEQIDAEVVLGVVTQAASEAAATATFGAVADRGAPMTVKRQSVSASKQNWEKAAHDYAGFGLQGLLFFAIETAVTLGRERRLGIWKRLRAAPIKPSLLLLSKGLSSTGLALGIILLIFLVGALLFHIRILGSVPGFAFVAVSCAIMTATFGLLVATIGRTETQGRAISVLLILVMLATGGAWFPMDRMPPFVQTAAEFLPVRWAVEGFDACTWRGLDFASVSHYGLYLLIFGLVFGTLAAIRFRFARDAV